MKVERTCVKVLSRVSAITGTVPSRALQAAFISETSIAENESPARANPSNSADRASPIDADDITRPAASAVRPVVAIIMPAPTSAQLTPKSDIAPERAMIVPITGFMSFAAIEIVTSVAASAAIDVTISFTDIPPRIFSTGTSIEIPADTAIRDTAAPPVPFIARSPIARMPNEPPITVILRAISGHDIELLLINAFVSAFTAAETIKIPAPITIMFFGIILVVAATEISAHAIPAKPFPSCSQPSPPRSVTEDANIFIAAPIAISATPVDIKCFALPVSFVKAEISSKSAPIEARPFAISFHDILPKSQQADARIFIAAPSTTIPIETESIFTLNFAVLRKISTSASRTPIPARPFASSSQLSAAKSTQADDNTLIAAENITMLTAPFIAFPLTLDSKAAAPAITPASAPTPTIPFAISSQLSEDIFFIAPASIDTENARAISIVAVLDTPRNFRLILPNTASAVITSASKTVTAARLPESLSSSIAESAIKDTVSIATAAAIFSNVPA